MANLAGNVKGQTDRVLRQFKVYGEIVEYVTAITAGASMTVIFINKYRNIPCCFTNPQCTITLTQDANGFYIGATLVPIDVAETYNFMAICSGQVIG